MDAFVLQANNAYSVSDAHHTGQLSFAHAQVVVAQSTIVAVVDGGVTGRSELASLIDNEPEIAPERGQLLAA